MKKLIERLRSEQSLPAKLLRGGAWLGAGNASEQGLRFARNIIMARLLAPEAFGLMAIALSVCSLFQVLTGLGIKESVVQNPRGAERAYLNGAWWLAAMRGVGLYLMAMAAAPWIARFYESPELKQILHVAFVGVLAQGAMSAGAFVAIKQMRYSRWVIIQSGGSAIGIVAAVVLATQMRDVWALVIGYATEGVARCVLSYLICPFRPGFRFEAGHLKALFRFAGGMFGLPLLLLVYTEGSVFTVGKLCNKQDLGVYAMALTLARIPSMLGGFLVDLLMPAFADIQHDLRRVNQSLLKVTAVIVLLAFPAVFFVAIFGRDLLTLVYGARYAEGGLPLAFLFANEVMILCGMPMATMYLAIGQPALLRRFSLIRAVMMAALIWPATRVVGLTGAALAPLVAMSTAYAFQLFKMRSVTGLNLRAYSGLCLRGLAVSLPMAVLWFLIGPVLKAATPRGAVAAVAVASGIVWLASAFLVQRSGALRQYFWPFS
jgi:lipopolysaccharide exporter